MDELARGLTGQGYEVVNIRYESREKAIVPLAEEAVGAGLRRCREADRDMGRPVHFVAYSMGGILVRAYFARHEDEVPGRVVMLGPPNQGTSAVNRLLAVPGMRALLGPAASQLGEGPFFVPAQLPAVNFQLGVIAGSRAFNPLLSLLVDAPDDGVVSVEDTRVSGMCAHLVLPVTHFLMMYSDEVVAQTLHFIRHGEFAHPDAVKWRRACCP